MVSCSTSCLLTQFQLSRLFVAHSAARAPKNNASTMVRHMHLTKTPHIYAFLTVASLCYKDTPWLGMYRQSETRAGNHRGHTCTRNISPPTQANNTARGARKQPFNQGTIHAASEDTTHTSNIPHRVPPLRQAQISQRSAHRRRNRYRPNAHTNKSEAPGQLFGARKHV